MTAMHAKIGDSVKFSRTVGESDIYLFAGLTGDLSQNHVDDEFMSHSIYGKRIAHGADGRVHVDCIDPDDRGELAARHRLDTSVARR